MESVNEFKNRMTDSLEEAKAALAKSKDDMALYYNRKRTPAQEFKAGDMVFLDASDIQTTRPSRKLSHCRLGPFPIDSQVGNGAYQLRLPPLMSRLHPVFNVVKLSLAPPDCHGPCLVTFFPKNNQRTAPMESPMMTASPLFSPTITTGHLHRTYIGAPSEYSLHSATTKTTCILIIVITNQHRVLSTAAQPQPHHAPHTFHVPGQSHHTRISLEVILRRHPSAPSGIQVSLLYVHSTTICSSQ